MVSPLLRSQRHANSKTTLSSPSHQHHLAQSPSSSSSSSPSSFSPSAAPVDIVLGADAMNQSNGGYIGRLSGGEHVCDFEVVTVSTLPSPSLMNGDGDGDDVVRLKHVGASLAPLARLHGAEDYFIERVVCD